MFTASLPPSIVASVRQALRVVKARPELRKQLWDNVSTLYDGLKEQGFTLGPEHGPVVGVHLPDRMTAIGFWRAMLDAGIYVNVAVPPATPNGVSLLRCSLCAVHTREQLEHMVEVMTGIGRQFGVLPDRPSCASPARASRSALLPRMTAEGGGVTLHVHAGASLRSASADAARAAARAPRQARDRLPQLVAQPGASACARGAGRHRGRHQGREARPHRADRRSGEHLAAHRVQPRRPMAGRAGRPARRHRHSRQPRRLCRHGVAREPGPVGRLHRGRRSAAGDRLRRLPDLAPARTGGAGRPVERRAQAASARHRHPGRGADRRGRADVEPISGAKDCVASC